mmetsp:Transcript_64230/g.134986  ORF Transcript_64230/g.134986 Transcript_64230/m.134986 type:complete len:204 (+) Transcript_64230:75-686(+)
MTRPHREEGASLLGGPCAGSLQLGVGGGGHHAVLRGLLKEFPALRVGSGQRALEGLDVVANGASGSGGTLPVGIAIDGLVQRGADLRAHAEALGGQAANLGHKAVAAGIHLCIRLDLAVGGDFGLGLLSAQLAQLDGALLVVAGLLEVDSSIQLDNRGGSHSHDTSEDGGQSEHLGGVVERGEPLRVGGCKRWGRSEADAKIS